MIQIEKKCVKYCIKAPKSQKIVKNRGYISENDNLRKNYGWFYAIWEKMIFQKDNFFEYEIYFFDQFYFSHT